MPSRPAARISSALRSVVSRRERPKAASRSQGAAPGPSGGGPLITAACQAASELSSRAAIRPSREPKRRKTVPLPTPARWARSSMVSAATPQVSIARWAAASSASRLRAASARSGGVSASGSSRGVSAVMGDPRDAG